LTDQQILTLSMSLVIPISLLLTPTAGSINDTNHWIDETIKRIAEATHELKEIFRV